MKFPTVIVFRVTATDEDGAIKVHYESRHIYSIVEIGAFIKERTKFLEMRDYTDVTITYREEED